MNVTSSLGEDVADEYSGRRPTRAQESAVFEDIRQGMCACFVYLSQQISIPEQVISNHKQMR